jgi:hypothetical protein
VIAAMAVSVASASPLPHAGKAYTDQSGRLIHLTLVIDAFDHKLIDRGSRTVVREYVESGGAVNCPALRTATSRPFAVFGFPRTRLRRVHGRYSFHVSETVHTVIQRTTQSTTMTIRVTGRVVSSRLIAGTVRISGGPCAFAGPVAYSALLSNLAVAPPR